MKAYADTSFLASLYAPDANAALAAAQAGQANTVLLLTLFGEVELTNPLEMRVFRKEIRRAEANAAYAAFQEDVRSGALSVYPVPTSIYEKARKHTAVLGVRTLDVLHVAAVLVLGADRFYSFDVNQQLAKAEGLAVERSPRQ